MLKETTMTERKIELKSITLETKPMTCYEFWHWESINRPFRNAHQVYYVPTRSGGPVRELVTPSMAPKTIDDKKKHTEWECVYRVFDDVTWSMIS